MSSTAKTIIGILTFSPIVFIVWYLVSMFLFFHNIGTMPEDDPANREEIFTLITGLFLPLILFIISSIGLLIYYLVDIFGLNPKLRHDTDNNKLIWTLVIVFTVFIGMVVYYFIEIIPRKKEIIE